MLESNPEKSDEEINQNDVTEKKKESVLLKELVPFVDTSGIKIAKSGEINTSSSWEEFEVINGLTLYDIYRQPRAAHFASDKSDSARTKTIPTQTLNTDLVCPICLGMLHETMIVMECLHRFCSECIQKCLRLGRKECPACRTHVPSRRSLRRDYNFDEMIAKIYPNLEEFERQEETFIAEINRTHNVRNAFTESCRQGMEAQTQARRAHRNCYNKVDKKSRKEKTKASLKSTNRGTKRIKRTVRKYKNKSKRYMDSDILDSDEETEEFPDGAYHGKSTTGLSQRRSIQNRKRRKTKKIVKNRNVGKQKEDTFAARDEIQKNQVWFLLLPHPVNPNLPNLEASYLRTSYDMKIHHIKRYLSLKLREHIGVFDILVTNSAVSSVRLGNSVSINDVSENFWSHDTDLVLHYKMESPSIRSARRWYELEENKMIC